MVSIKQVQIPFSAYSFKLLEFHNDSALEDKSYKNSDLLYITTSEEEARNTYENLKFYTAEREVVYLPAWDNLPFDRSSPSKNIMSARVGVLGKLARAPRAAVTLIMSVNSLMQRLPPKEEIIRHFLEIKIGQAISQQELIAFLIRNSFVRNINAVDSGDFAVRGDIVDIVTESSAYRINFVWDKVESIKTFDVNSQISQTQLQQITLHPASELILSPDNLAKFKQNFLAHFGVNHSNDPLYVHALEGIHYPAMEQLLPLFYESLVTVFSYLQKPTIVTNYLFQQAMLEREEMIADLYDARLESNRNKNSMASFYFALPTQSLWLNKLELETELNRHNREVIAFTPGSNDHLTNIPNFHVEALEKYQTPTELLIQYIQGFKKHKVIFASASESSLVKFENLLQSYEIKVFHKINNLLEAKANIINIAPLNIEHGFKTADYIFISELDLFGERGQRQKSARRQLKNILAEVESLSPGDLVVHKDHGIGRFEAVKTLNVSNVAHDCIELTYLGNDKLYIPIENIDLVSRYGGEIAELDKLGSVNWQKRKARVKDRIGQAAQKLMKQAAERELARSEAIEVDPDYYHKFCAKFPYVETEDQARAILEIKEDFVSSKVMDRLICGDVGFGKTEVAMRAAFMVAASKDNKNEPYQVAIIAPTTILVRQHYASFLTRFSGFNFNIKQISRLVTSKEAGQVKHDIAIGKVNIIIGTHALLSKEVKFANLKLLIIDEEQHFGVKQKERLRELKANTHVLSLSATPIPRTLQMSLLGIKSLSLIATPPIDRLPIHTVVSPFDGVVIKDALMREHFRGGRSFYVCPRIKDLEEVEAYLKASVPELKYVIAHGQMAPSQLDHIMNDFYEGKYDILLSTTIIESGIDIPAANTMIMHRADMLGLSQLYQLRGRVGRGKIRGYAYLTINSKKMPTEQALKRLQAMQNIDNLGAGFAIASQDMDIRGFGNLVGEEQSGQVREVGIELYQDMLAEAVENIRCGVEAKEEFSPTINLGLPVYIDEKYITDQALRMGIYKRIAALATDDDIEQFKHEMVDRFGHIPESMDNLIEVVRLKNLCKSINIEKIDAGNNGYALAFRNDANTNAEMIMNYVQLYPKTVKIKPNNKLIILQDAQKLENRIADVLNIIETIQSK